MVDAMTGGTRDDTADIEPRQLQQLMLRVAAEDSSALAELYKRTSGRLFGICVSMLRSESDAEDVLQDVYTSVWRRARQYDPAKAGVLNWMAVIARNRSIDQLRGRRASAPIDEAGEVADDAPSAFDLVEAADDRRRLAGCLEELDEKPRRAIRTAFFEGLSYAELASREAVPLGTMKSWIRRGLLRLRGCLDR